MFRGHAELFVFSLRGKTQFIIKKLINSNRGKPKTDQQHNKLAYSHGGS